MYLRLTKINNVVMPLTIWTSAGSSHDQIYTCTKPALPKLLVNLKCFVCDITVDCIGLSQVNKTQ